MQNLTLLASFPLAAAAMFALAQHLLGDRDPAAQQRQLAAAHVKYVILHRPKGGLFQWPSRDGAWSAYVHTYRMVDQDQDMMVPRVF